MYTNAVIVHWRRPLLFATMFFSLSACGGGPLRRGDVLAAQGKYPDAIVQYEQAVQEEPQSAEAHLALGLAYAKANQAPKALTTIKHARTLGDSQRARIALADVLVQLERNDDATQAFKEAVQHDPENISLLRKLAGLQARSADREGAIKTLKQVIERDPEDAAARVQLADSLLASHEEGEALEILKPAKKNATGLLRSQVEVALGHVFMAMNRPGEAVLEFKQAVKRMNNHIPAILGLARAHSAEGTHEEGIEVLQVALRDNRDNYDLHLALGKAYIAFQLPEQAIPSLMQAVNLGPKRAEAYPVLLDALDAVGASQSKKIVILKKASAVLLNDLVLQMRYAKLACDKTPDVECETALRRAVAANPTDVEANFLLGMTYAKSGKKDEALQAYTTLADLDAAKAEELKGTLDTVADNTVDKKKRKKKAKHARARRAKR